MLKKIIANLALAALFFCAQPAALCAQESKSETDNPYPPFVIEIPAGWKADYRPSSGSTGQQLKLTSPDRMAYFSLEIKAATNSQWQNLIEDMSIRPAPDHGPPNFQNNEVFIVTFNDTATGQTGRKIYQRLPKDRYLIQVASGFHENLPALINSVEIKDEEE